MEEAAEQQQSANHCQGSPCADHSEDSLFDLSSFLFAAALILSVLLCTGLVCYMARKKLAALFRQRKQGEARAESVDMVKSSYESKINLAKVETRSSDLSLR